jgi:hypothetical protein
MNAVTGAACQPGRLPFQALLHRGVPSSDLIALVRSSGGEI